LTSRRPPDGRELSFGGVVVRGDQVCVIRPRGRRTLTLPKGGQMVGEDGREAAAREVREETGLEVEVGSELGVVEYSYRRAGRRIHKTVRYFLCTYRAGETADHDDEVDEARWLGLEEARRRLSYPGERALIERAIARLNG
jgi:ADP-ribose pyrophosphatase YjhB (NUDIX family)